MPRIVVAILTLGIVCAAGAVHADPIRLTQGALVGDNIRARLDAASSDGQFVIHGLGDSVGGIYTPVQQCNFTPDCVPGTVVGLDAMWSGSDFFGEVIANGVSYPLSMSSTNALVSFTGSWTAPAFAGRSTTTVSAPFQFEGSVLYPPGSGVPPTSLIGDGIATLGLQWTPLGAWEVHSTRYQFAGTNPVPEPMTLLMVSTGGALLLRRGRHRLRIA